MKGQFSRYGFNAGKRFSGLYNQQGRMITDADLNEGHNIQKNRLNALGDDAIKSGVPAVGGMINIEVTTVQSPLGGDVNTYLPSLTEGDVYVDGIRGHFKERRKKGLKSLWRKLLEMGARVEDIRGGLRKLDEDGIAALLLEISTAEADADTEVNVDTFVGEHLQGLPEPPVKEFADYYNNQADFPVPPDLKANSFLYVDLWERPIFWWEDGDLVDPGWHGADTAFRTKTMVQLKTVGSKDVLTEGGFPKKGNARLASFYNGDSKEKDPCDPCADELDIPARTGNKLVRLEVLDVEGPANRPVRVRLAWSDENAALAYPTGKPYPEGFEKEGAVYQFFSKVTESHMGVFEEPDDRKPSHLEKILPENLPTRTDIPGDEPWPFVRRWNGYVWVRFAYQEETSGPVTGFSFEDPSDEDAQSTTPGKEAIEIETGNVLLSLRMQVAGIPKSFVAGDYWLTLVRENAVDGELVKEIATKPMGITHHYLCLFEIDDSKPGLLDEEGYRRLSFPPLTDLPADHVSFAKQCPEKNNEANETFEGVENVEQALLALCRREAKHINFNQQCPTPLDGNENNTFEGVTNVEGALLALCEREAKHIKFNEQCPTPVDGDENNTFEGITNVEGALLALCRREAKHIDFVDDCDNDIFNGASNVQTALSALCDLKAKNVKFDEECPELFDGAINVQDALKKLCDLNAEHINFDSTKCSETFDNATNVQAALEALCDIDCCDEHNKYLHDWGAVCGLKVSCLDPESGVVLIEPGALVDQTGKFSILREEESLDVFGTQGGTGAQNARAAKGKTKAHTKGAKSVAVKPRKSSKRATLAKAVKGVPEIAENVLSPTDENDNLLSNADSLVLAIKYNANDKNHTFHRLNKEQATGFLDKTFEEKRRECELKFKNIFTLGEYPEDKYIYGENSDVLDFPIIENAVRLILRAALEGCNGMNFFITDKSQFAILETFYWRVFDRLDYLAPKVAESFNPEFPEWQDSFIDSNFKIYKAFVGLINAAYEGLQECYCAALIPECPGEERWNLVPICEIRFNPQTRAITGISNISCRKFCLTWRSMRYWFDPILTRQKAFASRLFCEKKLFSERSLLAFSSGDLTASSTVAEGLEICVPAYNSGTLSTEETSSFWGKEGGVKLKTFEELPLEEALTLADNSLVGVVNMDNTEGLSGDNKHDIMKGNVTPEDIFARMGSVYKGDEIALFTNNKIVKCAVLVNVGEGAAPTGSGTPQSSTAFIPPEWLALLKKMETEKGQLLEQLGTLRSELNQALVDMRNYKPITSVVSDPKKAARLNSSKIYTIGDLKTLKPKKREDLLSASGLTKREIGTLNKKVKEDGDK